MKWKLSPLLSDIFISVYILVSLYFRFKVELNSNTSITISILTGICFTVLIWSLIKLQILNPNWFGLLKNRNREK